ncbi:BREX-1 system adenine-specific DNA-methyltransferase PglX [Peptoniphilus sp. HCN-40583]|uniref:BREX-1 system adenine-specific DNA-methyltransferase PglX n=1 Tax=Peptoniphilus sp. HCN-40583 TaxID=3134662 RepID=UPI0030C58234
MDKNAIKKFATEARRELMARVSQRALLYGISPETAANPEDDVVEGRLLSSIEKRQRAALIEAIKEKSYDQVMEEVAYTWFNRYCALRFMEVNGYLPSRVRVFTDENNAFKPQILAEAIHLELEGLDREKVFAYKEADANDDLYKYLLITQCNALSGVLPKMFQKIADATELLFPDNLLREGSVLHQMIENIPEEDWKDAVQIIGWLYQYYNSEKKDEVNAALNIDKVKISKENIPAVTQLFTPDWIVRYMVENSLGRLWMEGHPDEALKSNWKYYLEEAEQEPEVEEELEAIRKAYREMKPEDIRCIDPCCGSGHILVYLFDVLVQIYESYGYRTREAVASIVKNNLYGLDIDERAAQLAYFAVMMKARQYDRSFFNRGIQPHVHAIEESNAADPHAVDYFCGGDEKLKDAMETIIEELHDAKEYGSIISVSPQDWEGLYNRFEDIKGEVDLRGEAARKQLLPLVEIARALAQKYDVVVTNPPYLRISNSSQKINQYAKTFYPTSKYDMSTLYMEKTLDMCNGTGIMAMINIPVWMSKKSFKELRHRILAWHTFVNMLHCGRGIFGSDFGTTAFVIRRAYTDGYAAVFHKLFDEMGAVDSIDQKEKWFFEKKGYFVAKQNKFLNIASYPIAYSMSLGLLEVLDKEKPLKNFAYPRKGLTTGDNDIFARLWYEVDEKKFSMLSNGDKWFPMTKGGDFRRWYGNNEYVVNWENDGDEIRNFRDGEGKLRSCPRNVQFYFREGISWNDTTAKGKIAFRYQPVGYISNASGPCVFADVDLMYLFGLLNSVVSQKCLEVLAPNMKFEVGQMALVPIIKKPSIRINKLVENTVVIARTDWDSYETSWDFKHHPFLRKGSTISESFNQWKAECEDRFLQLKANEEELNRIFIDIYGLQDELTPEVADKDITVYRVFDTKEDVPESMAGSRYIRTKEDEVVSFISYAVGCMFGRYSLDVEGLAYAGGDWDESRYLSFPADRDNIIPISDDVYFEDDILSRFVKFVEVVYGKDTLDENLKFIADALGGKGQPKEVIRNYFLNGFYADHCSRYSVTGSGKRPIYWLFDSGKKNGFKCLIYMHRYSPDTIARIRTDYVHEQQARYRSAIDDLEARMEKASPSERVKLSKKLKAVTDQAKEVQIYEEKIHHLADQMIAMDLDDGVVVNYAKFQDVLAKVK